MDSNYHHSDHNQHHYNETTSSTTTNHNNNNNNNNYDAQQEKDSSQFTLPVLFRMAVPTSPRSRLPSAEAIENEMTPAKADYELTCAVDQEKDRLEGLEMAEKNFKLMQQYNEHHDSKRAEQELQKARQETKEAKEAYLEAEEAVFDLEIEADRLALEAAKAANDEAAEDENRKQGSSHHQVEDREAHRKSDRESKRVDALLDEAKQHMHNNDPIVPAASNRSSSSQHAASTVPKSSHNLRHVAIDHDMSDHNLHHNPDSPHAAQVSSPKKGKHKAGGAAKPVAKKATPKKKTIADKINDIVAKHGGENMTSHEILAMLKRRGVKTSDSYVRTVCKNLGLTLQPNH